MNNRIRYVKDENGGWKSMRVIRSAEGVEYVAVINPDGKSGYIKSPKNNAINIRVAGTSPHKVKIALKTTLELLKCKFARESRKNRLGKEELNVAELNSAALNGSDNSDGGNDNLP